MRKQRTANMKCVILPSSVCLVVTQMCMGKKARSLTSLSLSLFTLFYKERESPHRWLGAIHAFVFSLLESLSLLCTIYSADFSRRSEGRGGEGERERESRVQTAVTFDRLELSRANFNFGSNLSCVILKNSNCL